MRVDYRRVWEQHTGLTIPPGWHIHHIDGDGNNHDPLNLNCVSPTMHWWAHYLHGDPVALYGKFIQGAAEAGRLGGRRAVESGQLASIQTRENQTKGRRNRDPEVVRNWAITFGLKNVENGVLARARAASPVLYNKAWASKAGQVGGKKNKGKRWITSLEAAEDRKVSEDEVVRLIASGMWRRGRSRGGWNTMAPHITSRIHSMGGKAAMKKRWGGK